MQAFSQMLSGVGFIPTLQSSYNQGKYPLTLSFKTTPDVMPLPTLAIEFIPLTTLLGIPTPAFGRTEENLSEERRGEAAANDQEETPPLVHRVEGSEIRLVGPSKMTSWKPLRPHQLTPLFYKAIFAWTNQTL